MKIKIYRWDMTVEADKNMNEQARNKFQLDTDKHTGMRMSNIAKEGKQERNKMQD